MGLLWGVEWLNPACQEVVFAQADSAPVDLSPKGMKVKLEEGRKSGSWFARQRPGYPRCMLVLLS